MSTRTRSGGGFVVTERDVELVAWLGRVRLATVEQVQARFGMARSKAYGRLQGLRGLGLVRHERAVPGPGVFLATRAGLSAAEVELAPATMSLGSLRHDLAVTSVMAELEPRFGWGRILTEREMRAHQHTERDDRYWVRVQKNAVARSARHWPDLAVHWGERWLAVEVELSQKQTERLSWIVSAYRSAGSAGNKRQLLGVLYLVGEERRARALANIAEEVWYCPEATPTFGAAVLGEPEGAYAALAAWSGRHREGQKYDARERAAYEQQRREQETRQRAQAEAERASWERRQRELQEREARAAAEAAKLSNRFKRRLLG